MEIVLKQIAVEFLNMVIAGQIDEAYQKFVDMTGKHHNVYFPAGFTVLRDAMKENHGLFPHKKFVIKQVIAEGETVATHSELTLDPEKPKMSVVHMFRFKNNKIVEMWDVGQQIPADMSNKDGAF